jgi:ferredoxin-NADP reductase
VATESIARPRKLAWTAAKVISVVPRTQRIKSFFFALPGPTPFVPGQHMDVRLVAPDGYEAQRSYSIASAPEQSDAIELAIERLQDGEVSPFFHDEVRVGDEIELRGPIGGHFMWSVDDGGPLLLVGGGSGVVPLASMIRHHAARASDVPVTLVTSGRTASDLLYLDELRAYAAAQRGFALIATVTREAPAESDLKSGRIDRAFLAQALAQSMPPFRTFVCGSNAFVETVTQALLDLNVAPDRIRTERYGG